MISKFSGKQKLLHQKYLSRSSPISRKPKFSSPKKQAPESKTKKVNRNSRLKTRYNEDPQFKIKMNLSARLNQYLRATSEKTLNKHNDLIGTSIAEFKKHIESGFQEGMTWENRRLWHIDHIRPCASFDLSDLDQQKIAFHWTNMKAEWAEDNMKKNSFFEGEFHNFSTNQI